MKLRLRFFIVIALVAGLAAWQLYANFREQLKPALQQATEDVLVDTAAAFALVAEQDLREGRLANGHLAQALRDLPQRDLQARIWGHARHRSSIGVYVTDARGIVLFDSAGKREGFDYSRWNDVYLTLRGEYGARSSKEDPNDKLSSVMYVGTPLRDDSGRIVGVLTVYKPIQSLQPFLIKGEEALSRQALLILLAALLLGLVLAWWIARGIGRLVDYADATARGERQPLPVTGSSELDRLAAAMEHMRSEIDGRRYIEDYVQALTHEMKSPLAAIGASAELLQEESLPAADRERFLGSIRQQNLRAQSLIERLLHLARLEQRRTLEPAAPVNLAELWASTCEEAAPRLQQKSLRIEQHLEAGATVRGDAFLLRLALGNLLDNALAFAPSGSVLDADLRVEEGTALFRLRDHGSGIPDYALAQVFDRFYSLPRPDGGPRSSGLGLPLVREIALLHGGSITLQNHPDGGAVALLRLPAA
jgi:two-component system sensor histidine kinase CreC